MLSQKSISCLHLTGNSFCTKKKKPLQSFPHFTRNENFGEDCFNLEYFGVFWQAEMRTECNLLTRAELALRMPFFSCFKYEHLKNADSSVRVLI